MKRLLMSCILIPMICLPLAAQKPVPKKSLVPSIPPTDRVGNVMLRNPNVTVRRLEIAPQSSAQIPGSTHDYLLVALSATKLTATGYGTSFQIEMGSGDMQVMQGGWPHKLLNDGSERTEVLAIEITRNIDPKHASCGIAAPNCNEVRFGKTANGEYSQSALFETSTTKLMRVQLGPDGSLRLHADARRHLLIAITDLKAHCDEGDISLHRGEVHWIDGGFEELRNDGTEAAQMLIVELKS